MHYFCPGPVCKSCQRRLDLSSASGNACAVPDLHEANFQDVYDRFSYGLAASIMADEFQWAQGKTTQVNQVIDESHGAPNYHNTCRTARSKAL